MSVKHDVTLPIDALADFVEMTMRRLDEALPGVRMVTYGHVGDGNLHHNLSGPPGDDAALREHAAELTEIVYEEVLAQAGSISAEHGVGVLKREAVARAKDPVEVERLDDRLHGVGTHMVTPPMSTRTTARVVVTRPLGSVRACGASGLSSRP